VSQAARDPALPDPGRRVAGAHAVIRRADGRVLLSFRVSPPGWELPGGHVARAEAPAATVVREVREEVGCEISVDRLTGTYTFRGLRHSRDAVFLARLGAGTPSRSREVLALMWADPDRLPPGLFPWFHQRIRDAVAPPHRDRRPVHRVQAVGAAEVLRHGLQLAHAAAAAARRGAGRGLRRRPGA